MIETEPITSLPETQRTTVGVWLCIITPETKIFVTQNLKPKFVSQKIPGQWNAPAETVRPDEDTVLHNGNQRISFLQATIPRAIREEIGRLNYDTSRIKDLGSIWITGLGQRIVASPFLIPVEKENDLIYQPEGEENGRTAWVPLNRISRQTNFAIGEEQVPLFRSPMVEIAENIRAVLEGRRFPIYRLVGPTISQSLVNCF